MPEGQFLGWQPGRIYTKGSDDIPWVLKPGSDLVIQVHMNPTGKLEDFQCSVGLYFTDQPPEKTPFKIKLTSFAIDIPPSEKEYHVLDEFELPSDVEITRVLPHAHYLCRRMEGYAELPDGTKKQLILIRNWDFNWQADYLYKQPVFLPRGTKIKMDFTYDNSSKNRANPHSPPLRVVYGPQSSDEMAELWFQLLLKNPGDKQRFYQEYRKKNKSLLIEFGQSRLAKETTDPNLLMMAAQAKLAEGDQGGAYSNFLKVVQLDPKRFNAWFNIGSMLWKVGQLESAKQAFDQVRKIDPNDAQAYGSLGLIHLRQGNRQEAEKYLRQAIKLDPNDAIALKALQQLINDDRAD
jgi:Flp pilus assembly protein TadD